MEPQILLVEDDAQISAGIKLILEENGFNIITASNGKKALELIDKGDFLPDLILSDIMMPVMDGYTFYQKVSEIPHYHLVPFVFISALSSPENVRFGKLLGADDYITKPFQEDDLLAVVIGKISKSKKIRKISEEISKELLKSLKIEFGPSLQESNFKNVYLFLAIWDDRFGPVLNTQYPSAENISIPLQQLAFQLFQTSVSVYGQYQHTLDAEGVKLRISNIGMDGYLLFDFIPDENTRGGKRRFMITALAPKINYLESVRIKDEFLKISNYIKKDKDWCTESCWEDIVKILSTPVL